MKTRTLLQCLMCLLLLLTIPMLATAAPTDARPGSTADATLPGPDPQRGMMDFVEGFDDITNLPGWFLQNNSSPLGTTDWFQGNPLVFLAQAGADDAYIAANFNNTAGGTGTISNWLLTPEMDLGNTASVSFWTRTVTGNIFPDRLEVRASSAGASTDVGVGSADVGDFTTLLLEINPTLSVGGYPDDWAEFVIDGTSLPNGTGRIAFRYFVDNAGPAGANSNYIGIDSVTIVPSAAPITEVPTLSGIGIGLLFASIALAGIWTMRRSFA